MNKYKIKFKVEIGDELLLAPKELNIKIVVISLDYEIIDGIIYGYINVTPNGYLMHDKIYIQFYLYNIDNIGQIRKFQSQQFINIRTGEIFDSFSPCMEIVYE